MKPIRFLNFKTNGLLRSDELIGSFLRIDIQDFRLGLNPEKSQPRIPGLLIEKLGDAFFEPLSEDELQQWE